MKKGFFASSSSANGASSPPPPPPILTSPPSATRSGKHFKATSFKASSNNHFAPLSCETNFPPLTSPLTRKHLPPTSKSPYDFPLPQAVLDAFAGVKNVPLGAPQLLSPMDAEVNISSQILKGGVGPQVNEAAGLVVENMSYVSSGFKNVEESLGFRDADPVVDDLGHGVSSPVGQAAFNPPSTWKSLFKNKPGNAGTYTPRKFDVDRTLDVATPPQEVVDAGKSFWKDQLVGFFLDAGHTYTVVKNHLLRAWKLKGNVKVKCDKSRALLYTPQFPLTFTHFH